MRINLQYLIFFLLISCGQGNQMNGDLISFKDTTNETSSIKIIDTNNINEVNLHQITPEATVEFEDFNVKLIDYSYYREPKQFGDTIRLETEVGEDLDNKLIQVIPRDKSDKFKVYIALEQNLTASVGEKQSQDLTDWKKIEDYIELRDSSENYFRTIQFHRKEKEMELNKDFQKIKANVLELKGEYITKELDSVTSLKYLPVELWISRIIIKIVRIRKDGTHVTYYIDTVSPWGC